MNTLPPLKGQVLALFGGGGLIGRAVAPELVKAGARVVIAGRSGRVPEESLAALDEAERDGLCAIAADATDPAAVDAFFSTVLDRFGRCDTVVNMTFPRNAEYGARFEDVGYESFKENVGDHLGAAFLICQKGAQVLERQGGGSLINFSSIYGHMAPRFEIYEGTPMTKEVEYIVAKSAIIHLTRYLAQYLKGRNIRVNCVSPGGVFDHQHEAFVERYNAHCNTKGMMAGGDLAGTLIYLSSDMSRCVTGQNITVDDGFSL